MICTITDILYNASPTLVVLAKGDTTYPCLQGFLLWTAAAAGKEMVGEVQVMTDFRQHAEQGGRVASKRPWVGRGVAVAIVLVSCMAAYWLNSVLSKQAHEIVHVWVPPSALNIGTVWETDQFEWILPVENREETPIEVESFSTSCNCMSVEPKSFALEPGARRELRLQINLNSQLKPTGEVSILLLAQLKASGDSPAKRFSPEWKITGQVRRVLAFDRDVYLGRHSELSQPLVLGFTRPSAYSAREFGGFPRESAPFVAIDKPLDL